MHIVEKYFKNWSKGKLGLRIHFLVFFSVNLILFLINMSVGMQYPWFLWPMSGWGIAMGIHFGVIFTINNYEKSALRGLVIHGFSVFFVNLALFIFYFLASMGYPWFLYPLFSLGLGFGIHASVVYSLLHSSRPAQRGFLIHCFVEILLILYFFLMDVITGGSLTWFFYIAFPLLVAIGEHYYVIRLITPQREGDKSRFMQKVTKKMKTLSIRKSQQIAMDVMINQIARKIHISAYLIINIFLFCINVFVTGLTTYPWFLWVLFSWGWLLVYHIRYNTLRCKYLEGKKPHVGYFLMELVAGIVFFVFVEIMSQNPYNWFFWTLSGFIIFTLSMKFLFIPIMYRQKKAPSSRPSISISSATTTSPRYLSLESTKSRFCPSCGAKTNDDYLFCESCGFQFSKHTTD